MTSSSFRSWLWLLPWALATARGEEPITFTLDDLPRSPGVSQDFYFDPAPVGPPLGSKGGPQRWDFSGPRTGSEVVHTIDVLSSADGADADQFPAAAYVERLTRQSTGVRSWSYYRAIPGEGRAYYGFYDTVSNPADPLLVFEQPTLDLPATVAFGQGWSRSADWQDLVEAAGLQLTVAVHFTCTAAVNAYGTLVLPELGEVPALRVMELHAYASEDLTFGFPLGTQYQRLYYWLAKGLGKVVTVTSKSGTSAPPENLAPVGSVLRLFASRGFPITSDLQPVRQLTAGLQAQDLLLQWAKEPAAILYHVQAVDDLAFQADWPPLSSTTNTSWSTPLADGPPRRFFRVFWSP